MDLLHHWTLIRIRPVLNRGPAILPSLCLDRLRLQHGSGLLRPRGLLHGERVGLDSFGRPQLRQESVLVDKPAGLPNQETVAVHSCHARRPLHAQLPHRQLDLNARTRRRRLLQRALLRAHHNLITIAQED